MPLIGALCCGERVGTVAVAGDLAIGEQSSWSAHRRRVPCAVRLTEEDDGTVAMLNEKSVIILNSVVICYFCVELNRAPKIMNFFV